MASWTKINEKLYTVRIDGKLQDIACPYGKVEKLFFTFVGDGGVIGADGSVQNDIVNLITNFTKVGDILLSTYGAKGEVISQGDCSNLSTTEIMELFEVATDCIEGFITLISSRKVKEEVSLVEKEKPEAKKATKA